MFEPGDVVATDRGLDDAIADAVGGIGEPRAEREQVALNLLEHRLHVGIHTRGADAAEPRVELVDVAVGVDARIRLDHARAVEQAGLAAIAGPGVDFHRDDYPTKVPRPTPVTACPHERSRPRGARRRTSGPLCPRHAARRRFRRRLLEWYRRHGRDLPWRETSDPYHILVSEVMLQQTQVDRVLPKYDEWLDEVPDA